VRAWPLLERTRYIRVAGALELHTNCSTAALEYKVGGVAGKECVELGVNPTVEDEKTMVLW
jgi:hypothetical protein